MKAEIYGVLAYLVLSAILTLLLGIFGTCLAFGALWVYVLIAANDQTNRNKRMPKK